MVKLFTAVIALLFLYQSAAIAGQGSPADRIKAAECFVSYMLITDPSWKTGKADPAAEINIIMASNKLVKLQQRYPSEMKIIKELAYNNISPRWMKKIKGNPSSLRGLISGGANACGKFVKSYPDLNY